MLQKPRHTKLVTPLDDRLGERVAGAAGEEDLDAVEFDVFGEECQRGDIEGAPAILRRLGVAPT